ncbi:hypothetical protein FE257_002833 [Aspergillus nanangensis]|uniref:Asl1-like glycosyl hydrolase catalytic domain-containing protein n=1 Tax=Aspergillus nanangensis TaxID=2582783 RepID=A0AAD4GNT2_ASPNN|nr:hypothetical protein FE257_002833 [Aspergillus nanangensis]
MVSLTIILVLTSIVHGLPDGWDRRRDATGRSVTCKRGAAYNDASTVAALTGNTPITWAYSWDMSSLGILPNCVEFVPMLWGVTNETTNRGRERERLDGWRTAVDTALSNGSGHILGFNEPDLSFPQASMDPVFAASKYIQYITPFSRRATLVTPAVSNSVGPGEGLQWIRAFLDACRDCQIDVLGIHWYGDTVRSFQDHIAQSVEIASQYGLESIWVTEFGLTSDLQNLNTSFASADFLAEVLPWLDSEPWVERYAYFKCAQNYLLSGNGLTRTGSMYTS